MTDVEQAVNRAAITARSAATVLHATWPDIQENQEVRKLVIHLEDLCHHLVGGDPPAAEKAYTALCAVQFPSGLELDAAQDGI